MSKESQNFLQRAMQAYTDYNPFGVNERAEVLAEEMARDRVEYLEDQYNERVDPTNRERGVKPTIVENLLLGLKRKDFDETGSRINIRELKKTDIGAEAQRLGLDIKPNSSETKLKARVERKKKENKYGSLKTRNTELTVSDLTDQALDEEIRRAENQLGEQEKYGVIGPDGKTRTGGSVLGQIELNQEQRSQEAAKNNTNLINEQISSSKAATALNNKIATNNQTQQQYVNDTDSYRYEDLKIEKGLDRKYDADREDAKFAANLETVKLQNAAEMERYELMLQNDREVRRSDDISDLMAALTMLGGAFLI